MSERKSLPVVNNETPAQVPQRTPLVLRGHHLENIHDFYYGYAWGNKKSPANFAQQVVNAVIGQYNEPQYTRDVLGTTLEELKSFKRQTAKVIKQFVELPDDHPLELVEGKPDDICSGCAVGEHCRKLFQVQNGPDVITEDGKWIDWFIDYSRYYSEKPNFSVEQETALFSDTEPQTVRRVKTTLGAIRNAMPFWIP